MREGENTAQIPNKSTGLKAGLWIKHERGPVCHVF